MKEAKYNKNNIFKQIIDGLIKTDKLYEDDQVIVIKDIKPCAKQHILVLPKNNYIDFDDFIINSTIENIAYYFKVVRQIAHQYCGDNYRIVSNNGKEVGQTIFHFHTHILSGLEDINLVDKKL